MPEAAAANYGIFTGLLAVWAAKMTTPDKTDAKPVYDTPKKLGEGIKVTITAHYKEYKLAASNVMVRNKKAVDYYEVEINADALTHEMRAYIGGRKADKNGVAVVGDSAEEDAELALGFVFTRDNASKELWWLLRGMLNEDSRTGETEGDGTVNYQTPTLKGRFDRRRCDGQLAVIADTENAAIKKTIIDNWFKQVYEPDSEVAGVGV